METLLLPFFLLWVAFVLYFLSRAEPSFLLKFFALSIMMSYIWLYREQIFVSWIYYQQDVWLAIYMAYKRLLLILPYVLALAWFVQLWRFFYLPFVVLQSGYYMLIIITLLYWSYYYVFILENNDFLLEFFKWCVELIQTLQ